MTGSVPIYVAVLNALMNFGRGLGFSDEALIDAMGLEAEAIADPDATVDFEVLPKLWAFYIEACPDVPLGVRMGQMVDFGGLGIAGQLILSSPDVRTTIDRRIRWGQLLDPLLKIHLEESKDLCRIVLRHKRGSVALGEPMEMMVVSMCERVRRQTGSSKGLVAVDFAHPRRHPEAVYKTLTPAPVFFERDDCAVTFERWILDVRFPEANVEAGRYLERYADSLIRDEPEGTLSEVDRVRRHLHGVLRDGKTGQDEVARALGVSTRTLQRRLKSEGSSFAQVLGDVRRVHALAMLQDPELAVYEVAFLLGYSEAPSFHRAFKRWTGQTPAQYRKSLVGDSEGLAGIFPK